MVVYMHICRCILMSYSNVYKLIKHVINEDLSEYSRYGTKIKFGENWSESFMLLFLLFFFSSFAAYSVSASVIDQALVFEHHDTKLQKTKNNNQIYINLIFRKCI